MESLLETDERLLVEMELNLLIETTLQLEDELKELVMLSEES